MIQKIGGERVGSGGGMSIEMQTFERSNNNLDHIFKTTMSAGTVVPFYSLPTLLGESFDIEIDVDVKTHPTIGPLFGSYKVQLDMYWAPLKIYMPKLAMNILGVGLKMNEVLLPRMQVCANNPQSIDDIQEGQINPSSLFHYLGIGEVGYCKTTSPIEKNSLYRYFNAIPYIMYYDVYKNYVANKSEGVGYYINNLFEVNTGTFQQAYWRRNGIGIIEFNLETDEYEPNEASSAVFKPTLSDTMVISWTTLENFDKDEIYIGWGQWTDSQTESSYVWRKLTDIFQTIVYDKIHNLVTASGYKKYVYMNTRTGSLLISKKVNSSNDVAPRLEEVPLVNFDRMRRQLLANALVDTPFEIKKDETSQGDDTLAPYTTNLEGYTNPDLDRYYWKPNFNQQGLAIATYLSDIYNNWINKETIVGDNGVSELTKIDVSDGYLNLNTFQIAKTVYNMLNQISITDGSYKGWKEAVYGENLGLDEDNPIYVGGMSKTLSFAEVYSQSQTEEQPLGTLAGRGISIEGSQKGGKMYLKSNDIGYLMGTVTIKPKLDYYQGVKWDMNIKNMDEWHKPAMDTIGWQDLLTDNMHGMTTKLNLTGTPTFKSIGKQPAWMHYRTATNRVHGNFALEHNEAFMVLTRRYTATFNEDNEIVLKDATTYIDPSKFNYIFADTRIDAQNFWVQIKINNRARRKISNVLIPKV